MVLTDELFRIRCEYFFWLSERGLDWDGDVFDGYFCPPVVVIGTSSPWPRNSMEGSTTIETAPNKETRE